MEKAREFQKNIYFCFIDYAKAFDCVDHKKLWKILKEMGIPDHLTCLLRNLYAGQDATVTTALISRASKIMLKILQVSLQQYVNWEIPDVQAGFRKGRGTRGQIPIIHWIIEKAREFLKNIYFCFIDYAKTFDCVDHNKL